MDIPPSTPDHNLNLSKQATPPPQPISIRPVRNDLRLMDGRSHHGSPTWTINDLSANRFYNIGWLEFEMLSRWHMNDATKIIDDITATTTLRPTMADLQNFITFLKSSNLLIPEGKEERETLRKAYMAKNRITIITLIKNYLFFKVPLWHPDAFLERLAPRLDFLFTKTAYVIMALLTIASLILVAQMWTSFQNTFIYFFTFEGVVISIIGLSLSQVMHEMGHAVVAKRLGLKVPVMGVAFLVLFPIVYTDTTDAWRLKHRREKMAINIAGIVVDTMMAVIATYLWYILPDGPMRSACFIMASVTWIMTLAVNLNPLMRFDGYYLLSDGLRIDNMQSRSFEYAKWYMRRNLFGFSVSPPETVTGWRHYYMLCYSYATWIYRFFLFLGIAITVYHLFFKALGIFMMLIDVVYFIGLPIWRELRIWWKQRKEFSMNRIAQTSLALLCVFILILILPWQTHIEAPALLKSQAETTLYAPVPAHIEQILVKNGDLVKEGQLMFSLKAEKLDRDARTAELEAERYKTMQDRGAIAGDWREQRLVSMRNFEASKAMLSGIEEQKERLNIRAPFDGKILDIDSDLHAGRSVDVNVELGRLIIPSPRMIIAYVRERDFSKIRTGMPAWFESDVPGKPVKGTVAEIDPVAQRQLEEDVLASDFKGGVAARRNDEGKFIPHEAIYRVVITIDAPAPELPLRLQRGWVSIKGESTSILMRLLRQAQSVFVREAAFN